MRKVHKAIHAGLSQHGLSFRSKKVGQFHVKHGGDKYRVLVHHVPEVQPASMGAQLDDMMKKAVGE